MALSLAGWSRLPYIATSRGPTQRMMCRLQLHIIRLAIAAMFLMLLINLVSNAVLFTIVYEAFMVLPTTRNKTSSISLTPTIHAGSITFWFSSEIEHILPTPVDTIPVYQHYPYYTTIWILNYPPSVSICAYSCI